MGRCRPLTTYCFMQTDGSQEAHPPSSELFGLQRTLDFFKDRRAMAGSQISKEIRLEVCNIRRLAIYRRRYGCDHRSPDRMIGFLIYRWTRKAGVIFSGGLSE